MHVGSGFVAQSPTFLLYVIYPSVQSPTLLLYDIYPSAVFTCVVIGSTSAVTMCDCQARSIRDVPTPYEPPDSVRRAQINTEYSC